MQIRTSIFISMNKNRLRLTLSSLVILYLTGISFGALIEAKSNLWDPDETFIMCNGDVVSEQLPKTGLSFENSGVYKYIDNVFRQSAIAHSGSSVGESIFQHVYAYTLSPTEASYQVMNTAGNSQSFLFTESQVGKQAGRLTLLKDRIDLDGSLLLLKPEGQKNLSGLLATFEIVANRVFERETLNGTKKITRRIFKGAIDLIGRKNGKIGIRTRGKIRRRDITAVSNENETVEKFKRVIRYRDIKRIQQEGDLFQIDLSELEIPYRFLARVGREIGLEIQLTSYVSTLSGDSGAEVIFLPAEAVLPEFQQIADIPEPGTLALLLAGGMIFWFHPGRMRHFRKSG